VATFTVPVDRIETKAPVIDTTLFTETVPETMAVTLAPDFTATMRAVEAAAGWPVVVAATVATLPRLTDTPGTTETAARIVEIEAMFWMVPVTGSVPPTVLMEAPGTRVTWAVLVTVTMTGTPVAVWPPTIHIGSPRAMDVAGTLDATTPETAGKLIDTPGTMLTAPIIVEMLATFWMVPVTAAVPLTETVPVATLTVPVESTPIVLTIAIVWVAPSHTSAPVTWAVWVVVATAVVAKLAAKPSTVPVTTTG